MEYYYGYGTISRIQGEEVTSMMLDRLYAHGGKAPEGVISNTYCNGFYSKTEVHCAEEMISYFEDYDMPVSIYTHPSCIRFQRFGKNCQTVLHKPAKIDPPAWAASFLEEHGVFYPIVSREAESGRLWHICVFDAARSVVNKQLRHDPLSDVVIRKNGDVVEINVHIRRQVSEELRMAILSLPFSYGILPG